jgi:hypothetical protein
MSRFLKEPSGAIHLIDSICSVIPMPIRGDRQDQTKVTAVHTTIVTAGGQAHQLAMPFDQVVALVDPPSKVEPPAQ